MKTKKIKPFPKFKSEDEEAKFWATHDFTEYLDTDNRVTMVFPNLKPSTETISLRLPEALLISIKTLANKRDVPYQSLIKVLLAEKMRDETKETIST